MNHRSNHLTLSERKNEDLQSIAKISINAYLLLRLSFYQF